MRFKLRYTLFALMLVQCLFAVALGMYPTFGVSGVLAVVLLISTCLVFKGVANPNRRTAFRDANDPAGEFTRK